jgi:hypothetical protein
VIVRILVDGPSDLSAVHAIQDRLVLQGPAIPLSISDATRTFGWPVYFVAAEQLLKSDQPQFKNASQVHRAMRGEVCLGTSKAARFSVGPPSTTSFDGPLLAVTANCRCSRRAKARSSARNRRNLANVG